MPEFFKPRNCLDAAIALLLGTATTPSLASVFVTNCNDSGAGSLRYAVSIATDTVDLSELTASSPGCANSTISLHTGSIVVNQDSLTIQGPLNNSLTVSGKYAGQIETSRVISHYGSGRLNVNNLTISDGNANGSGGCIYSTGTLVLQGTKIYGCEASSSGNAYGGGVYAKKGLMLSNVTVANNTVVGSRAIGGGLSTPGYISMFYSTISGNFAGNYAGGLQASSLNMENSTISSNTARLAGGGIVIMGTSNSVLISNSTIVGNFAQGFFSGGLYLKAANSTLTEDTIAANSAESNYSSSSPGLTVIGGKLSMLRVLISGNFYGSSHTANDFFASQDVVVSGGANFIQVPISSVPANTIVGRCPLLGSLRFNGGVTETLALQSGSPAIDAGGNRPGPYSYDQRGFPFVRFSGTEVDIGAYEVQLDDIIFNTNFEGCP